MKVSLKMVELQEVIHSKAHVPRKLNSVDARPTVTAYCSFSVLDKHGSCADARLSILTLNT